jgi:predicted nucleic acid-binding protein
VLKIDSCSLIYLAKSDMIPLAKLIYQNLRITRQVYDEVVVEGKKRNHPDAFVIDATVQKKMVGVVAFKSDIPAELAKMGPGEAETIMESKTEKCTALLDDVRSKAYAARRGIEYTSVDVLLIEALARKKITMDDFEEFARRLGRACSMRAERYAELLRIGKIIGGCGK